jgi:predicted metal-dependent phosphoesterase TrpH
MVKIFPLKKEHPFVYTFLMVGILLGISNLIIYFTESNLYLDFLIYFLVMALIIVSSVLISFYGPAQNHYRHTDWLKPENYFNAPIDKTKWNIILDTHSHTKAMEGRMNVEQVITFHQAMGFNACCITEHNTLRSILSVLRAQKNHAKDFLVIPGFEYTTSRIHMCILGIKAWKGSIPLTPTDLEIQQAIKQAHERGGVVVVNHYPWSTWGPVPKMPDHPTREQMLEWGVDLIEVANWDDEISRYDPESLEFAKTHENISPVVGTDLHYPERIKICGWTVLNAKNFTVEAVMDELRNHRTDVVLLNPYVPYSIYHPPNIWYEIFRPFIMIGNMFQTMYNGGKISNFNTTGALIWVFYIITGFWLYQLVTFLI